MQLLSCRHAKPVDKPGVLTASFRGAVWEAARENDTRGRRDEGVVGGRDAASRTGGRGPGVRAARVDRRAGARPGAEPVHHDRHHDGADARERRDPRQPYSLPAEEMPPSRTVAVPETTRRTTSRCGCPTRPATSPTSPPSRARRSRCATRTRRQLHADPLLRHDGRRLGRRRLRAHVRRRVDRRRRGVVPGLVRRERAHSRIGPLSKRWTPTGEDGAPCSIFHVPARSDEAEEARLGQAAADTTGGPPTSRLPDGADARAQRTRCSRCRTSPARTVRLPGRPDRARHRRMRSTRPSRTAATGWYDGAVGDHAGRDRRGGRRPGVEQMLYRIDGGRPSPTRPVSTSRRGRAHARVPRDRRRGQRRGVQVGRRSRSTRTRRTTAARSPGHPFGDDGWHDGAVTVTLRRATARAPARRGDRVPLDGGDWTAYTGPIIVGHGRRARRRVPLHRRRGQRRGRATLPSRST